jgi:hypothetical protein
MKLLHLTLMTSISFQLYAFSSDQIDCTDEVGTSFFNTAYFKSRSILFLDSEADLELKNLMERQVQYKRHSKIKGFG